MVKIGLIGLGGVSEFHLKGLASTASKIVAVSSSSREKGEKIAQGYGARFFNDYHELINYEEVEAVVIGLPNYLHYDCCLAAIDAGKHIFCEKPLTVKERDSLDLVNRVKKKGIVFQVGYMKRFHPGFVFLKESLPKLGDIEFLNFCILSGPYKSGTWHTNPQLSGGGIIVRSGSHHLDLLRFYAEDVEELWAEVKFDENTSLDCYLNAIFRTKIGVTANMQIGIIDIEYLGPSFTPIRGGWDESVLAVGSEGVIRVDNPTWQGYEPAKITKWFKGEPGPTEFYVDAGLQWAQEMEAFISSIEKNKAIGPSVEDGYFVDKIIHKIYLSSKTGKWISVGEEVDRT